MKALTDEITQCIPFKPFLCAQPIQFKDSVLVLAAQHAFYKKVRNGPAETAHCFQASVHIV